MTHNEALLHEARVNGRVKSKICICGQTKIGGKPFCRKCFSLLPSGLKTALSNQLLEGFIQAFDDAKEKLRNR